MMTEKTLESLIRLLTLLALTRPTNSIKIEKNLVVSFLQSQFDKDIVEKYVQLFENYYQEYVQNKSHSTNISKKIDVLAADMYAYLQYRQRIYLIVSLFEFSKYLKEIFEEDLAREEYFSHIFKIGNKFNIDLGALKTLKSFTLDNFHLIDDKDKLLVVVNEKLPYIKNLKQIVIKGIRGQIFVLNMHPDFFLIKYMGNDIYYIDKKILKKDTVYVFSIISAIIINNRKSIYFNDIQEGFALKNSQEKYTFEISDIEFSYGNNNTGIKKFNFFCESGELIGILGSSGSGKTTLMNLLNGNLPLKRGEILINGHKLTSEVIKKGRIGYVPQDDLLLDDLTVFDNLYYNTVLCQKLPGQIIKDKINEILELLGIFEIRNLKVSSPGKKIISGGQRKRLNIANELIREPDVFFIDEPTSGLSSSDSWRLMNILKHLALRNKIVFVNIHQPTDAVFNLFDKIIILDRGGYPIFTGRPNNALSYFKSISGIIQSKVNIQQSEQEEIMSIIEEPFIDEFGNYTNLRKIAPEEWYSHFLKQVYTKSELPERQESGKMTITVLPGFFRQFWAYFMRNTLTKISNRQYRNVSLLISPVLAFILSILCKHFSFSNDGPVYLFSENDNLPGFYFMGIIAVTFIGLMTSAEDIIKDNKIRIRERYLSLSTTSYYLSKIILLFVISIFQTFLYAVISTYILKLSASFVVFWLTLFLISFLANIIGLTISALLNSLVTIYIVIPIILIPQILLSGVVVKYEKLHPSVSSEEFVPFIGDLMPTRWAYELLVVNQFKNNKYQAEIFNIEKQESMLSFMVYTQIPQIQSALDYIVMAGENNTDKKNTELKREFILSEMKKVNDKMKLLTSFKAYNFEVIKNNIDNINLYLDDIKQVAGSYLQQLMYAKDLKINRMIDEVVLEGHFNRSVADLVKNMNRTTAFKIINNNIVQISNPIYVQPYNKFGRALFYSSEKRIGNFYIDTVIYNFIVIIIMIFIGILIIINEIPYKIKTITRLND